MKTEQYMAKTNNTEFKFEQTWDLISQELGDGNEERQFLPLNISILYAKCSGTKNQKTFCATW